MVREPSHLDRFLGAVHRRMVLWRLVERVGVSFLVACGLALFLMPVLIWRGLGSSTTQLVLACMGLGVFAGLVWGFSTKPTRLAAAVEADRQLRLADLLGTALYLRRAGELTDEMSRAVVAMAEARCAGTSPSVVILNRIGARGWGGIGLAAALVVTVALAGGGDRVAEANASRGADGVRSWKQVERAEGRDGNVTRLVREVDLRRAKTGTGGDAENDPSAAPRSPSSTEMAGGDLGKQAGTGVSQHGTGSGSSGSRAKSDDGQGMVAPVAGGGRVNGAGASASSSGGSGLAQSGTDAGTGGAGAGNSGSDARRAAPVWASEQWAADRDAALRAVQSGGVPDAYRDLVRDYFGRR